MPDRAKVMSWLEGLAQPDWHKFHSDTEVQVIAESALALLKEHETVEHAKEILCANGWKKMRFPEGTIGKWDDPEIVRCKDCDNRECDGRAGTIVCGITGESHSRLWFCADGERKEGR